jgi:glycosyltransferase involved in cell wall biosynthesis
MRILTVLTYYRPHISGLTIYAERLAKAFVRRGHQVTIYTSQYSKELARHEVQDGINIIRAPVMFRLSKGVIMPSFGFVADRLVRQHDVIQLHLPQLDAAGISLRGRLLRKPTVITYHCDLQMPPGLLAWGANQGVHLANNLTALFTHRIVTYTHDYAENSPYLNRYKHKLMVIPPPVELPGITGEEVKTFAQQFNPRQQKPVIGMVARFAAEKGVEVLLNSMPQLLKTYPDLRILFAGPYKNIIGEEEYSRRLMPTIGRYEQEGRWQFIGALNPQQMSAFYPNLDVLAFPSLNSTEAFGLSQIEAMMKGVPSVASDLPGVRQPVLFHKMGEIIPVGDSDALTKALLKILANPQDYKVDPTAITERYQPDTIAAEYEVLFEDLQKKMGTRK